MTCVFISSRGRMQTDRLVASLSQIRLTEKNAALTSYVSKLVRADRPVWTEIFSVKNETGFGKTDIKNAPINLIYAGVDVQRCRWPRFALKGTVHSERRGLF